ncbi:hypothetical protein Tco_0678805 [Tanacetum coccineum]|uniref:Uncharacterized protein n=1 Tax=Tanacetum coccineum TaxID=301880 RepID=A0ABQ4XG32_9ASTR
MSRVKWTDPLDSLRFYSAWAVVVKLALLHSVEFSILFSVHQSLRPLSFSKSAIFLSINSVAISVASLHGFCEFSSNALSVHSGHLVPECMAVIAILLIHAAFQCSCNSLASIIDEVGHWWRGGGTDFCNEFPSKGTNDGKKRDSFYQDQGAGKKEQNQNCLLTMDDGVVNLGEHTLEEEETNHALMAISSNNEVSLCSKTCIDSYNKLKTLCDEQTNQLGEQEAKILAYTLAVKKLEAQVVTFQKQQLSLNEQLTFQANEIYAKYEKLKKYRRIGMKDVKEKEQLQKIVDLWKNSSKKLWRLVDSEEDFLNKPLYSRFSKTDNFKGVPHPLTGDYTPKPQEEIDDSLVNRANHFVPRPVQLNAVRANGNTGRANINTVRANVNSVRQNVNSVRTNINTVRSKQPVPTNNTNSFSPVRPQGTVVKTSAGYPLKTWRMRILLMACSGHMTGNKDHLDDFEECKGGSVTFRVSKGYITGKGRISVVFVNFGAMLHNISRDDLVDLYKIVLQNTTAYGPEEDLESAFAKLLVDYV